jgi:septal ring factor EnvC (AmiA/AmiB activator)
MIDYALLRRLVADEEQTLADIEYEIRRTERKLAELKRERDEHEKHLRDLRDLLNGR